MNKKRRTTHGRTWRRKPNPQSQPTPPRRPCNEAEGQGGRRDGHRLRHVQFEGGCQYHGGKGVDKCPKRAFIAKKGPHISVLRRFVYSP